VQPRNDARRLLEDLDSGKEGAEEELLPLLYEELRSLARWYMRNTSPGHTLQTTALVHEAYIRLRGSKGRTPDDRTRYMRLAARAMRSVLIDHARRSKAAKRGGNQPRVLLEVADGIRVGTTVDLLALDSALERLTELDARLSQVVELRFFAGLTETAQNN